jgi:hypothetical protein
MDGGVEPINGIAIRPLYNKVVLGYCYGFGRVGGWASTIQVSALYLAHLKLDWIGMKLGYMVT